MPHSRFCICILCAVLTAALATLALLGGTPSAEVAVIERWVREGAKLDADVAPDADLLRVLRKRWQPPAPPARYPLPVMVTALAFTPDGQRLVAAGHHELTVWDAAEGKLVQRIRTRAE